MHATTDREQLDFSLRIPPLLLFAGHPGKPIQHNKVQHSSINIPASFQSARSGVQYAQGSCREIDAQESIWIGSECQRIRKPNEAISFKESNAVCTYGAPWGTGDRVASRVTSAQIPTLERAQVMHGAGPASRTTLRADCRSLSNFSAR